MVNPLVILHGGAGNITKDNLPPEAWTKYEKALLEILRSTQNLLESGKLDALDAAVYAVSKFELNPLFNAGKGAVFTRGGRIELEASIAVTRGKQKRFAAISGIKHVKHPIQLAAEILKRGDDEDRGGAQGHVHICGDYPEQLARMYDLEMCDESYFWTRKRWEEHRRGLHKQTVMGDLELDVRPDGAQWALDDPSWDGKEYLPQGTVGAVVMDQTGTIAVATSTGGITNKLPGRIGDTPTVGSGFWAEQWMSQRYLEPNTEHETSLFTSVFSQVRNCLPQFQATGEIFLGEGCEKSTSDNTRAVAMSGTGNGDSFLRLAAVRTAAAKVRFEGDSLASAVKWMAGPNGELQKSAEERWGKTGEGEGGIIGIELKRGRGQVVFDFNCGGMFRAYYDVAGRAKCAVFRE